MSGPISGSECELQVRDADGSGALQSIEGVLVTSWKLLQDEVDVTTLNGAGWRQLLPGAGVRALEVRASGLHLGTPAEVRLQQVAFAGTSTELVVRLGETVMVSGQFILAEFGLTTEVNEEARLDLLLRSAGPITFF